MPDLLRGRAGTVLLLGVLTPLVLGAATWVVVDPRGDRPEGQVPPPAAGRSTDQSTQQGTDQGTGGSSRDAQRATVPERRRQQYVDLARRAVGAVLSGDRAAVEVLVDPALAAALGDLPLGSAGVEVRAAGLTGGDRAHGDVLVLLGGRAAAPVLVTVQVSGDRLRLSDVQVDLSAVGGAGADEDDPARRQALAAAARAAAGRATGEVLAVGLTSYARDRVSAVVAVEGPAGPAGLVVRLVGDDGRWRGADVQVVR